MIYRREFPAALTSYDLLKFTALLFMVADHIGAFFLPEELWLRVVGRLSAPIWLFLIGYANAREISKPMIAGTLILSGSVMASGGSPLPLCILATMLVCRLLIDPLMERIARAPGTIYPVMVILFLATLPTFSFLEYGSAAMLFVMIGYMVRHRENLPFNHSDRMQAIVISAGFYAMVQMILFPAFTFAQAAATGIGIITVALALTAFRPVVYDGLDRKLTAPVAALVKIGGRWSLEFYVAHLLLFKGIAILMAMEG